MCLCAERVALTSAYAAGEREITALAVIADTPGPVSPCGACRQMILELAPRCVIVLANTHGATLQTTPLALLPGGFTAESLPE
jgi:cytidine deaminase